jgi:hypothetical protein
VGQPERNAVEDYFAVECQIDVLEDDRIGMWPIIGRRLIFDWKCGRGHC